VGHDGKGSWDAKQPLEIRPIRSEDREWVARLLTSRWGTPLIVHRRAAHSAELLPGFLAEIGDERVGLITYAIEGEECEIVTLDSLLEGQGVGSGLLEALIQKAHELACRRIWLITTNDNLKAQTFYQNRGFRVVGVDHGAVAEARKRKPWIPQFGLNGVPIEHEIRMEKLLRMDSGNDLQTS
jgi:GNAT superfamily N-acetyltransferase